MSDLTDFAKWELEAAGWFAKDGPYGGLFGPSVLKMIELFSEEGHSGGSAPIAVGLFQKLSNFEPLTPLTGEDDEWTEVVEGEMWQNKRCYHVFKDAADGPAYDSTGRIFREPSGACYTNGDSRVQITFPYTPTREYVDVPDRAHD